MSSADDRAPLAVGTLAAGVSSADDRAPLAVGTLAAGGTPSIAVGTVAAGTTSIVAFGGIAVAVSAGVFGGPWLETRRRSRSVRTALAPRAPSPAPPGAPALPAPPAEGYEALFEAEQRRAFRIAVLMTGRADRATAIVEEAFSRALQQWSRLPADARVWFVQSTVVKLCLGSAFVRSLLRPVGEARGVATESGDLERAAATLGVLEPTRRAITILAHGEQMSVPEIAAVTGLEVDRVANELDAALRELGPVLGTVAA